MMWNGDESLGPLQGVLSKMGGEVCPEKVALAPQEVEERGLAYAEHMVTFFSYQLTLLDNVGFFALLTELPMLADVLKTLCARPLNQPSQAAADTESALAPVFELLSRLDPVKVLDTLWRLRTLLDGWDGSDVLQYLSKVQDALETVQPKSIYSCLVELSDLLEPQYGKLALLAAHQPFIGIRRGPPRPLRKLWRVRDALRSVLAPARNYLLEVLQTALEELGDIQAIVPLPEDQED